MNHRLVLASGALLLLAACESTPAPAPSRPPPSRPAAQGPAPTQTPPPAAGSAAFSAAEFGWSTKPGKGSIQGQVTYKAAGKSYVCSENGVVLSPETAWVRRRMEILYQSSDHATQPAAEPNLGPNLALGKPITSGAATCGSSESAAMAVDAKLKDNSKWCTGSAPRTLTVDLGSAQTVSSFVVKHAGLGGENTGWNTGAFTISTSTDNATWSTAVATTSMRNSRTYSPIPARTARYVRFEATTPTNNGDSAARIYELEVYGSSSAPSDLALRTTATAPGYYQFTFEPAAVVRNALEYADRAVTTSTIAVLPTP